MDKQPLLSKNISPSYYATRSEKTNLNDSKPSYLKMKYSKINDSKTLTLTEDPLLENRKISHPISNFVAIIHILKGNIGTGVLALPQAFIYSGLAFGTFGLIAVAAVCIHSMQMLLNCSQTLCLRSYSPPLDYAATAEKAFQTGPRSCRRFSIWARFITNCFIVITQIGFCVVYWVFAATNVQMAVSHFNTSLNWDYRIYMLLLLVPLLAMVFLPSLKYLAPFSIVANICEAAALGLLFYYLFQDLPPTLSRRQMPTMTDLPLWFGTVIYAYEGIALILPLENVMKRPRDMPGWTGVLNTAMTLVCLLYVSVSFYGYLRFGDALKGSITLSLPNEMLSVLIQVLYGAGIYFSLALQYYIPVEIMWPKIRTAFENYERLALILFRVGLLAFIYALGALIPRFELFISLVGALGGSYLSIIFPAILHMVTYWEDGLSWPSTVKDIFIVVFGLAGFATGTYASILAIVKAF